MASVFVSSGTLMYAHHTLSWRNPKRKYTLTVLETRVRARFLEARPGTVQEGERHMGKPSSHPDPTAVGDGRAAVSALCLPA